MQNNFFDVIIIGAGISGLIAAQILLKEDKRPLVIEASNFCGGLILSSKLGNMIENIPMNKQWILENQMIKNVFLELGASQISTAHTKMIRLAKQLDLTLYSQYSDGKFIYGQSQQKILQTESLMDVYFTQLYKKHVLKLISKIENISRNIRDAHQNTVNNPSRNHYKNVLKQYFQIYDGMTVQQFLKMELPDQQLRKLVSDQFQTVQSISVAKMSVLQVFLHQYGLENLKLFIRQREHLNNNLRLKEGIYGLVSRIKQKIERRQKQLGLTQSVIKLGQPVLQIRNQIHSNVEVITNKSSYKCFKVLFTASMAKAHTIKISKLSPAKRLIFQNQDGGNIQKIFLIFQSAFWRSKYSGRGVFSSQFPFSQMIDGSPSNLCCGILVLILCAQKPQKWASMFSQLKTETQRYQAKLKYTKKFISKLFLQGDQSDKHLQKMILIHNSIKDNVGYQTFTRRGVCSELAAKDEDYLQCYSRDEHNIIFLGSQLSKKFGSFMQGAVRHTRDKIYKYLQMEDPWNQKLDNLD